MCLLFPVSFSTFATVSFDCSRHRRRTALSHQITAAEPPSPARHSLADCGHSGLPEQLIKPTGTGEGLVDHPGSVGGVECPDPSPLPSSFLVSFVAAWTPTPLHLKISSKYCSSVVASPPPPPCPYSMHSTWNSSVSTAPGAFSLACQKTATAAFSNSPTSTRIMSLVRRETKALPMPSPSLTPTP